MLINNISQITKGDINKSLLSYKCYILIVSERFAQKTAPVADETQKMHVHGSTFCLTN